MKKIYILTDYRGYFLSKNHATPVGSGLDHDLLQKYFIENKYEIEFLTLTDAANNLNKFKSQFVIYTSSEDSGDHYKSFINDTLLALELNGANLIPKYKYLHAHNNKVFQELLRLNLLSECPPKSYVFGSYEDFILSNTTLDYPVVFKLAGGAMSKNVRLAKNQKELHLLIKSNTEVDSILTKLKNKLRKLKHKKINPITPFRRKFILQEFINGLKNDWKILIFGERFYIFERPVRKNDFRASGSGHDIYKYGKDVNIPEGIFNFAKSIKDILDVPLLSVDICKDQEKFYMIEYQILHFGTVGQVRSNNYYIKQNGSWVSIDEKLELEKVYADAISNYICECVV